MADGKISGSMRAGQQPTFVEDSQRQNDDLIAENRSRATDSANSTADSTVDDLSQTSAVETPNLQSGADKSLLTQVGAFPINNSNFGDLSSQYRAQQLSKQFDATQSSSVSPPGQTQTKTPPDEIAVEYLIFIKSNDLPVSAESLDKYNQIKTWLSGKTKPVSPLPPDKNLVASYNGYRREYKLADSEELRQKFIQRFDDIKSGAAERVFTDEEIKFLDDLRLVKEQNLKQVPAAARAADQENRATVRVDAQSLAAPRAAQPQQPRLTTGEPLKVAKNQENVENGFVRYESSGGETYLINAQTKVARSESDSVVADVIAVRLPSRSEIVGLQPQDAQDLYIGQVAANLSKKYDGFVSVDNPAAVKLPASDVKAFVKLKGVVDWQTKQRVSDDFFYAAQNGETARNHHVTKGDLKEMAQFSVARRNNLENALLGILAGGREPTAEETRFFEQNDVNVNALQADRRADYQMALTKGSVAKEDWDRFYNHELAQNSGDQTVANLRAAGRVGWISAEQVNKGLSEYRGFRNRVRNDIFQELKSASDLPSPDSPSIKMPGQARPQISDVTEADINRRIEDIRKYSLSPAEVKDAKRVADFYNRELGTFGGAAVGGVLSAGGKGWATIGGLLRLVGAESPAVALGKMSARMDLAAAQLGDDRATAPFLIKLTTGAVLDLPRIVLLSQTPLSAIGGFAAAGGLESYGKGDAAPTAAKETIKGAALGALFVGAGNLGKSVVNRTFFANAPKELVAGLSNADKQFLLEFASGAKNLPPAAYQRAVVSRVLGESTRIGTIFGGTVGIEKAGGATNDEAFASAAQMVIFDAVMHHGGRGLTKITSKSLDPLRDKLFRVVANGESRIVSVNSRNELVTFKKLENLPKEAQDRILDGTLIAKDGLSKTARRTTETTQVKAEQTSKTVAENKQAGVTKGRVGNEPTLPERVVPSRQQTDVLIEKPAVTDSTRVSKRGSFLGQRIGKKEMANIQDYLSKTHNIEVRIIEREGAHTFSDGLTVGDKAEAVFAINPKTKQPVMVLREGATFLSLFHEYKHFEHFKKLGLEKYQALGGGKGTLGDWGKEQYVFDEIIKNKHLFTKGELQESLRYINVVRTRIGEAPLTFDFSSAPEVRSEIDILKEIRK